jgi:hypothetical protein
MSFRAEADGRSPRRRSARARNNSRRGPTFFGLLGSVIGFFGRRPLLARPAIGVAILVAGIVLYAHLGPRGALQQRTQSEPARQAAASRPASAPEAHDSIGALINASGSSGRRAAAASTGEERASLDALISATAGRQAEEAPAAAAPAKAPAPEKTAILSRDPALETWFIKAYLRCWTPPATLPPGEKYAAQIRVIHNSDGSLSGPPRLVNPPDEPEWRAYAESAVRAVAKCNPLQVPQRYAGRFDQWRRLTLHFSPDSAL